jgi:16S rRNA (uracil1498-N3)-methyltransferase
MLKGPKQEVVIQKATELGVKTVVPFISKNTVIKIHTEKDMLQKKQRWEKIAYESCKQCERFDIPVIQPMNNLNAVLELEGHDLVLACVERDAQQSIKQLLTANPEIKKILIIIGPEGGWDNKELDLFRSNNIPLVTLGNLILRAETASIQAISDVIYQYEL